jgi:hypothetical protein
MRRLPYLSDVARQARPQPSSVRPPWIPEWTSVATKPPAKSVGAPSNERPGSPFGPRGARTSVTRDATLRSFAGLPPQTAPPRNTVDRGSHRRDRDGAPRERAGDNGPDVAAIGRIAGQANAIGSARQLDAPSVTTTPMSTPPTRSAAASSNQVWPPLVKPTLLDDREDYQPPAGDRNVPALFELGPITPAHMTASLHQPSGRKVEIGTVEIVVAPNAPSRAAPPKGARQVPVNQNDQPQPLSRGFATVLGLRQG